MDKKNNFLLAAGGTGGHLSPAIAVSEDIINNNHNAHLITDQRCKKYLPKKYDYNVRILENKKFSTNPSSLIKFIFSLIKNIIIISKIIHQRKITLVVSFGGYTSIACNLATIICRKKLILHEQNACIGRVNKFFLKWANQIIISYPEIQGLKKYNKKISICEFPVKKNFNNKKIIKNKKFTILVIGGSQGAEIFSIIFSNLIENNLINNVKNIKIIQQVKSGQTRKIKSLYEKHNLTFELNSYFQDINYKMQEADLIISRAGASSIAEIIKNKKVAIFIPYPHSKDNHQFYNAKYLHDNNACFLIEEKKINIKKFAQLINNLSIDKEKLINMENNIVKYMEDSQYQKIYSIIEKINNI